MASHGMSGKRVCVVTSGHLSGCPRMVKAADALAGAGYDVRMVSTNSMARSGDADARLHRSRSWRWDVVSYERSQAPLAWFASGLRRKGALAGARLLQPQVPRWVAARALGRAYEELVGAIMREPADFIYAGTIGALAPAAAAARLAGVPFGLDLEDFHCGEHADEGSGALVNDLARTVIVDSCRDATFVTAGSAAMGEAFRTELGVSAVPIHNVFPLPDRVPSYRQSGGPLRLYWFSQSLGLRRGLQDVIRALGKLGIEAELHVRAATPPEVAATLNGVASIEAPRVRLVYHDLAEPDSMVDECRGFDIGLSVEQGHILNTAVMLPNKATTYILAGLPVVLTDIPGQRQLAADLGEGAVTFSPGDSDALAAGLDRLVASPAQLEAARQASWHAAQARWHWEHHAERGALLELMERAVA